MARTTGPGSFGVAATGVLLHAETLHVRLLAPAAHVCDLHGAPGMVRNVFN
jgi:hypothetical protein